MSALEPISEVCGASTSTTSTSATDPRPRPLRSPRSEQRGTPSHSPPPSAALMAWLTVRVVRFVCACACALSRSGGGPAEEAAGITEAGAGGGGQ
jgi:hypothetical protein